jgi:adenine-specific DNA methylase
MTTYPKRLIEVDLPIKKISEHARREKSIRHGHISTLHIWWARRPLAACRAVICAALWPDPAQDDCPPKFREDAATIMARFCNPIGRTDLDFSEPIALRKALLDFIADFSNWDNSTKKEYLETARALTQSAHEALGGAPGTRPLVVDPFSGGGSIPLEALRVGADAFASDLNPVAVLLNKVVLEYIPKYGQQLADEVRKWGEWVRIEAEKELGRFYPKDPDGATPIAYLWARTIICEGPGCGAEVPLMRSLWLAKKGKRSVALKLIPDREKKHVDFEIIQDVKAQDVGEGTVRRGSATCPVCGYTTPVGSVRNQLKARHGGASDARLFCVVTTRPGQQGRFYRLPTEQDLLAVKNATEELERKKASYYGMLSLVPDEPYPDETGAGALSSSVLYGLKTWGDLFTPRQALALITFVQLIKESGKRLVVEHNAEIAVPVQTCLALSFDRVADLANSLCGWTLDTQCAKHLFARQAIPIVWNFAEGVPIGDSAGSWAVVIERFEDIAKSIPDDLWTGQSQQASATLCPLPDDEAQALITDPPYYDAIAYGDLSDFFYIWLRRIVGNAYSSIFTTTLVDKTDEIVQLSKRFKGPYSHKTNEYFEERMKTALAESRRVLNPSGLGVVVFAHKSTMGWEAMLQAMINAGWIFTGSWPIDTEMGTRMNAMGTASLASSIHLVCRPREDPSGEVRTDDVGYWSDVLSELPQRIHSWLPGLATEGVVGADAIFSCLGPALEIYSRYSSVEKASGEVVLLKEYLEEVWAAVSREALGMIFEGADSTGFEEDARLTAMWLWTLSAGANGDISDDQGPEADDGDEENSGKGGKIKGFVLEYDAARKIAQGLGAHLENLTSLVEIKGGKARLLPVSERASYLFGKASPAANGGRRKKKDKQTTLLGGVVAQDEAAGPSSELSLPTPGSTVLDRLHQAMLLFADGRSDTLKRFIEEDLGGDQGLWSLAQSLSALYPPGSEEKRWVDGVLARKKGLGI